MKFIEAEDREQKSIRVYEKVKRKSLPYHVRANRASQGKGKFGVVKPGKISKDVIKKILMGEIIVRNLSSVVRCWRIRENFWHYHPELWDNPVFSLYREENEDTHDYYNSMMMWAIAMIYDYDSSYRGYDFEDRVATISKSYLKKPEFFLEGSERLAKVQPVIDEYCRLQESSILKPISETIDTVHELQAKCKIIAINGTVAQMDKASSILARIPKILSDLERSFKNIEKVLTDKEDRDKKVRGDQELSLLEVENSKDRMNEDELV